MTRQRRSVYAVPAHAVGKALLLAAAVPFAFATGLVGLIALHTVLRHPPETTLYVFGLTLFALYFLPPSVLIYTFSSKWVGISWPWWKSLALACIAVNLASLALSETKSAVAFSVLLQGLCPAWGPSVELSEVQRWAIVCGVKGWVAFFATVLVLTFLAGFLLFVFLAAENRFGRAHGTTR
jgi:hypothetical protein